MEMFTYKIVWRRIWIRINQDIFLLFYDIKDTQKKQKTFTFCESSYLKKTVQNMPKNNANIFLG